MANGGCFRIARAGRIGAAFLILAAAAAAQPDAGRVLLKADLPQKPASLPVPGELERGETLLLKFSVRALDPGAEAEVNVRMEPGNSPFSRPLNMPAEAGSAWRAYSYPFRLRRAYDAGEARLVFAARQAVEVAGIELVSFGTAKQPRDLPLTRTDYAGRAPDAAWRKPAQERIEKIRKAELAVTVRDKDGKPVSGTEVTVTMRRHAFGFGSAVNVGTLAGVRPGVSPDDVRKYKEHILELFNKVVFENELKWPAWSRKGLRPATLAQLRWLRESGLAVRGHVLVWPSWRWTPVDEALAVKNDPPKLAKVIVDHIEEETGALRGQIAEWDVINEPYSNHDFMDIVGKQAMVEWFRAARRADPEAKLYINDYEILSRDEARHRDHYFETIRYLIDAGADVNGIGLQGHFPAKVTPPDEVLRRLDRFASFGRELQITEFDIDTIDEQTQADYTRDFMTAVFSHPAVSGFVMWGFWERSHWKPDGAMYRADWTAKPNGEVYRDLVLNQWWTRAAGRTDAAGRYTVRGFLGDYDVAAQSKTVRATLAKGGSSVEIRLE